MCRVARGVLALGIATTLVALAPSPTATATTPTGGDVVETATCTPDVNGQIGVSRTASNAQPFTASTAGLAHSATLELARDPDVTAPLEVSVEKLDGIGNQPSTVVARGAIPAGDVPLIEDDPRLITVDLTSTSRPIVVGDRYAIVLRAPGVEPLTDFTAYYVSQGPDATCEPFLTAFPLGIGDGAFLPRSNEHSIAFTLRVCSATTHSSDDQKHPGMP